MASVSYYQAFVKVTQLFIELKGGKKEQIFNQCRRY